VTNRDGLFAEPGLTDDSGGANGLPMRRIDRACGALGVNRKIRSGLLKDHEFAGRHALTYPHLTRRDSRLHSTAKCRRDVVAVTRNTWDLSTS
jgi:hypothetical protein